MNFLCFIGRMWFNDFMLRKLREAGHHAYTKDTGGAFAGFEANYARYGEDVLPEDGSTRPDFILIDNSFLRPRRSAFGIEAAAAFIERESGGRAVPVIGIDHGDVILSKYEPRDIDCFDIVLKGHGLPRDRDLMNWEIGVRWGLNRKEKVRQLRHANLRMSKEQIGKHRVSFDMGCAYYADERLRMPLPLPEIYDVFFVGVFDSLNRLHGLKLCRERFRTFGWLVKFDPRHPIVGIEDWKADPEQGRPERVDLLAAESERLFREHQPLFRPRTLDARLFRLMAGMSRVMPAFSGIGELGLRHYQALRFRRPLVCEDLSHIETIFPFQDGVNCVYVSDRLEDLEDKIRHLLDDPGRRRGIASSGFETFREIYRDGDALFDRYFLRHLGIDGRGPGRTNKEGG